MLYDRRLNLNIDREGDFDVNRLTTVVYLTNGEITNHSV